MWAMLRDGTTFEAPSAGLDIFIEIPFISPLGLTPNTPSWPMGEGGPVGTRSQASIRQLVEPEAPAQRNDSIWLQSLLSLPFCSRALARCSLNLVPV